MLLWNDVLATRTKKAGFVFRTESMISRDDFSERSA